MARARRQTPRGGTAPRQRGAATEARKIGVAEPETQ